MLLLQVNFMLCVMLGLQLAVQGTGTGTSSAPLHPGLPTETAAVEAWSSVAGRGPQRTANSSVMVNGSMHMTMLMQNQCSG